MLTTNLNFLHPELMDVVRLFAGAGDMQISHAVAYEGGAFTNTVTVDGRAFSARDEASWTDVCTIRAL